MKPKIIILNGPCGVGKSTLAKKYGQEHPLTLQLDIDDVWGMIGCHNEYLEESSLLKIDLAHEMARVAATQGHDVIIPQIIQDAQLADGFKEIAESCGADYYEVLLYVDKQEAIRRFILRGRKQGHPTGFRPGSQIQKAGGKAKLSQMYDNMLSVLQYRDDIIQIEPILNDIEMTYRLLAEALEVDR